uniref:START domain-containing protein n=1 Tax=Peronospora matthiolae TaxID=2874970 RepID=A0AAV1UTL9_9STRA
MPSHSVSSSSPRTCASKSSVSFDGFPATSDVPDVTMRSSSMSATMTSTSTNKSGTAPSSPPDPSVHAALLSSLGTSNCNTNGTTSHLSCRPALPDRTSGDVPRTVKLLSELERSWAMFAASWKVVELFGGMQIWHEQSRELTTAEPLNNVLLSTTSAGFVTFVAGHIGGAGFVVSVLLTAFVVVAAWWTLTNVRAKKVVPCFKALQVVDGSPSEIFLYLMGIKNYPVWDASVETAEVVHTIDDHSDIIHIVYRPVWMWPIWMTPRDLCLLRYWRRAEDGSYVICMQSALHPECPPMHGLVRATCRGGGFIISPRALGVALGDELTSMVTNVVHLDPRGWEGKLLQRLGLMHLYVRPQVLSLTGLRDVMEARKYVCPNVPEELSVTFTASTEEQQANAAAVQAGRDIVNDPDAPVSQLEEFPSNVPRSMWAEPDGAAMMVRGPDYLVDQRKIPSQSPYFRLVGVDLFQSSESVEHIASLPDNSVQRELRRHEEQGTEMPFTFVVNFVVPGTPRINLVLYYQAPHPSVLVDGSPSSELMADFLENSDEFRNERFKLIPCIVEGSFIVRQAVGSTPALIGKKLRQPTFRGKQYFELDVDIASSAVANRVVGLVSGYTKKLVIDMGFVLEGQSPDELPERLFGSVRLVHLDLDVAKKLT